jgi:uncharacterized protein (DUF608 family)
MSYKTVMTYACKPRSGITLGGIGTGGIELRQDGIFYNWHIFNNKPFGTGTRLNLPEEAHLFFKVRYQSPGKAPRIKLLQIDFGNLTGGIELYQYTFPWLSGVHQIEYTATFPFATLRFTDPDMPFVVEMEAFSPFIPHDVKNSALPGVIFNFKITSLVDVPVDITLLASLRNNVGYDLTNKWRTNRIVHMPEGVLTEMSGEGIPPEHSSDGTLALASLHPNSSYYCGWATRHPYYEVVLRNRALPNRDATASLNKIDKVSGQKQTYEPTFNTTAIDQTLAGGASFTHTFILGWHFPNFYSEQKQETAAAQFEGNYYTRFFDSAADVVHYLIDHRESLTARTKGFLDAFYDSSIDPVTLDQINSHLNTFISSSWLTRDGKFGIQEGITSSQTWGPMSTIDVAVYGGVAVLSLFPELDQVMWRTHRQVQAASGEISHGIDRNFNYFEPETREGVSTRVDLSMQYAILVLRNFFWTHDVAYLREMWDSVKCAIDYVLLERDTDGDFIPDAGGPNTSYDNLKLVGASAFVGSLWLSALSHLLEAAHFLKDQKAAEKYRVILNEAQRQFDRKLWTGKSYRLYNDLEGTTGQIDEGCMTDQLIGEWCNRQAGLSSIVAPSRVESVLDTVMAQSYSAELGLRNCSWQGLADWGPIPDDCYWDQANTMWTGSALAFSSLLIYAGRIKDAQKIIHTIDYLYQSNGLYFDHQEWGGHYFRPMSSWSILNAYLGLSVRQGTYSFAPKLNQNTLKLFFSFSGGTARFEQDRANGIITLSILSGYFVCHELILADWQTKPILKTRQPVPYACAVDPEGVHVTFLKEFSLAEGEVLQLQF